MTGTQAPHPSTHVVLDVGLTVGAGAALPSIDDFFGSASVPGGAAHKRVDFSDFSHKHAQPKAAALAQIASDDMDNECARLPQKLGADWRCVVGHRAPGRDAARGEGGGAPARPLVWMDVALAAWRGRVEGRHGKQERMDMKRQVTAWVKAGNVKLPRGVTAVTCAKKVISILDHPKNAPQIRSYVSLSLLLSLSLSLSLSLPFSSSLSLSLSICVSKIPAPRDTSSAPRDTSIAHARSLSLSFSVSLCLPVSVISLSVFLSVSVSYLSPFSLLSLSPASLSLWLLARVCAYF
jgi:hypothetical protein